MNEGVTIDNISIISLNFAYCLNFMTEYLNNEEELAHVIIGKAIEIHKQLGPGLPKEVYLQCLELEFQEDSMDFQYNQFLPVSYKGLQIADVIQLDFIVAGQVCIEVITDTEVSDINIQRMLKTIRSNDFKLGLIINFNSTLLKNGIRRVSNNRPVI
jgi:GxxExxY protein